MVKSAIITIVILSIIWPVYAAPYSDFAISVKKQYRVPKSYTARVLKGAVFQKDVIRLMDNAAEKLPWHKYKQIFVNQQKVNKSKKFRRKYRTLLGKIERRYKVPAELVVSIIGVESNFGQYPHRYRVLDSLYTLGFHYPRRAKFFKQELAAFVTWTYRSGIDPFKVKGSYAGAVGMPQFMPTNILRYGVDYDGDKKVDLVNSYPDALASIANYIRKHGWKYGKPTAIKTKTIHQKTLKKVEKKTYSVNQLKRKGVRLSKKTSGRYKAKIERFDLEKGHETWAVFHNFKAIMRYNPNKKYSLAVFLLSKSI